jgi:hypothetical protein
MTGVLFLESEGFLSLPIPAERIWDPFALICRAKHKYGYEELCVQGYNAV